MSSSLKLKVLIKQHGFNEIKNDLNWLRKSDKEIIEIHSREKRRKKLNGRTINGIDLTHEQHFEYVIDEISRTISYVNLDNIDTLSVLENGRDMLYDIKYLVINLMEDITNRMEDFDSE